MLVSLNRGRRVLQVDEFLQNAPPVIRIAHAERRSRSHYSFFAPHSQAAQPLALLLVALLLIRMHSRAAGRSRSTRSHRIRARPRRSRINYVLLLRSRLQQTRRESHFAFPHITYEHKKRAQKQTGPPDATQLRPCSLPSHARAAQPLALLVAPIALACGAADSTPTHMPPQRHLVRPW